MNQLVVSDLPYINKRIDCYELHNHPCSNCNSNNYNGRPRGLNVSILPCQITKTKKVYEPYKNNTIMINQNFTKINTLITNLTNQLTQSNTQINNLN